MIPPSHPLEAEPIGPDWFRVWTPGGRRTLHCTPRAPVRVRVDQGRRPVVETDDRGDGCDWTPVALARDVEQGKRIAETMIRMGAFSGDTTR